MKASITQDHHTVFNRFNQGLKSLIMRIGRRPSPAHDQAEAIQQQPQFGPYNPSMIGDPLTGELSAAAPLANRVQPLDAVGIDYPEQSGLSHKQVGPAPMGLEQPKQPGTLGQVGKQLPTIAGWPAIKGAITYSFKGQQQPHSDHLARVQTGLRMLGQRLHLIIYGAEQFSDKVMGGHVLLLQRQGFWSPLPRWRPCMALSIIQKTSTIGY